MAQGNNVGRSRYSACMPVKVDISSSGLDIVTNHDVQCMDHLVTTVSVYTHVPVCAHPALSRLACETTGVIP
jgi:hypothetical protein